MPISGLVLTLVTEEEAAQGAIQALEADSCVTVGARHDARLPVVLDTPDRPQDEEKREWIESLPGVEFLAVTSIYFEDEPATPVGAQETEENPSCN